MGAWHLGQAGEVLDPPQRSLGSSRAVLEVGDGSGRPGQSGESAMGLEGALPKAHVTSPCPEKWYFREFPSLQTRAIRGTPGQPPYDFLKIQSLALCQYHHGKGGEPQPQPQRLSSGWGWKQHC